MITKGDFINRVMVIMNEASLLDKDNNILIGADSTQVDRYIESSFVDAWRRCAKVMPRAWLKNSSFKDSPHVPDFSKGTGYVVLPSDFYLLGSFKMSGWKKSVRHASVTNELVESIQSNDFTRGSEIRPVCLLSAKEHDNEIQTVLNYYSLRKGLTTHVIEEAIYIPTAKPLSDYETDDDLELDTQMIEPLAYLAASTVFVIFEKYDISKVLEGKALEMFPGFQSTRGNTITTKQ